MLTKFESKSARVKGLAFHPVRPWICATLHSGAIQLWDYRVGTVIDRFEEHEGPVRGVDFHPKDPLIVSGGDDYKIKIWDYKLHRCLFTLLGHLDYVRTVVFHPHATPIANVVEGDLTQTPWILSASDDQTIRIWNYYTRSCISVLTGHNHYVMCAQFHPSDDLIVSASLDQTVRVWDTAGLKREREQNPTSAVQSELFGQSSVIVKYVLEGHDRGVNWASFHPTLPLIASAADDRSVKLWRMSESKAWEVDTLRGHNNNVSSVFFHPRFDLLISNSEDKSIRVWDVSKRVNVQTFRRDLDRFWILSVCKNRNLLAAGHDSGMLVFKLERERPAMYSSVNNKTYYIRGREVLQTDGAGGRESSIYSIRRVGNTTEGIGAAPRFLHQNLYDPQDTHILLTSETEGGSYELVTISGSNNVQDGKKGHCLGQALFLARNRFCILDRSRQLVIKNLNNETTKRVNIPLAECTGLLDGGVSGRILLKNDERVVLFDTGARRVIGEVNASKVKFAIWSPDRSYCALICKYSIIIVTKNMESVTTITDTVRIKSGQWSSSGNSDLFIFATSHHVKYLLKSGDVGTIRALEYPLYITRIVGTSMYALDREARQKIIQLDLTEADFKLALASKNYPRVMELIAHSNLCGRALVKYLQERGYPEVALHFVREPKTRFELALACGNLEAAMESAFLMEGHENSDAVWRELGAEALRQGNHNVVEMSYQRTKDFDRLSFLYLLSGDTDKLRKMLKIASMRKDVMGRYYNALLLGDATERVKVLEESGNLNLAFISATVHGLTDEAERLQTIIENAGGSVDGLLEKANTEQPKRGCLLQPPTPIVRADNWPTLPVEKTTLEDLHAAVQSGEYKSAVEPDVPVDTWDTGAGAGDAGAGHDDYGDAADDFGDDDFDMGDGDGGWDDDLDELGGFEDDGAAKKKAENMLAFSDSQGFSLPPAGKSALECWVSNSSHIADHASAGSVSTACQLLHRQIAASNFGALEKSIFGCYFAATASIPGLPGCGDLAIPLMRNDAAEHPGSKSLPIQNCTVKTLMAYTRTGYKAFQSGKFADSKAAFEQVLLAIPFCVTSGRNEASEVKELLQIAREYVTALRIKNAMSETAGNPARTTELSAYFTHCNLQPPHLLLALRSAMGTAFKNKNFITAASFARRLLELPDMKSERNAELRIKAGKVLQKSESMARNEHNLNYNDSTVFRIDCKDFVPRYSNDDVSECPYCGSVYGKEMHGKSCLTCGLSTVGVETIGLVTGG
mmetsp:Transcript_12825/g.19436  ORF Transcript_12825/g.19436 Transcript_12825/m.19436 type:complete len:1256 (+) Transcript_12825:97-3864(+)|eukprot:CAMPEP_0196813282 /NCGR_PEP_ID=MMETSP1362-20130617/35389_1 /TAXON_ID=163516 /ORGANISM="Leptocylindrus danicus, Strain CCMP1856" /LENGTH=1255 /DNA_ID=CAMNT_0042189417 /DNA_START=26 /DNA_END=3793 /DNA_ORIENTATION=+